MDRFYRCRQNDRLDRICKEYYGTERNGTVEAVLAANPGLSTLGPLLPLDTLVKLPMLEVGQAPVKKVIRLWGEA